MLWSPPTAVHRIDASSKEVGCPFLWDGDWSSCHYYRPRDLGLLYTKVPQVTAGCSKNRVFKGRFVMFVWAWSCYPNYQHSVSMSVVPSCNGTFRTLLIPFMLIPSRFILLKNLNNYFLIGICLDYRKCGNGWTKYIYYFYLIKHLRISPYWFLLFLLVGTGGSGWSLPLESPTCPSLPTI